MRILTTEESKEELVNNLSSKYSDLFESFDEAYIAVNWDLTIIYWNRAAERVTTVKTKDALGRKVYDVLPEMTSVDISPYLKLLQQRQRARFMMNTISRETHKPSIFEISMYPSEQGIVIIVEDKTEEEQTKRLTAIGATAGMVGHDIRNPLQAITGDLYLLKEYLVSMPESSAKQEVAESLDSIESNINYINKIVSDLQDYSRTIVPEYKLFNLSKLFSTVLQSIKRHSQVDFSVNIETSLDLNSDSSLLRRVLTNLIVNAIQSMPNGGR